MRFLFLFQYLFSDSCLRTTDLGQQVFWSIANHKHSRRSFLWCICLHFAHISDVLYQRHSYLAACKLWCFFPFSFSLLYMCLAYCKPENRMKNGRLLGVSYMVEWYHDVSVIKKILQPSLQLGVVIVFFDFILYSGGLLLEEMLPNVKVLSWPNQDLTLE